MLRRIDRILLRVPSVPAAVSYYRDTLGLKLLRHDNRLAAFSLENGAELIVHADPDLPADAVYYLVDDVRDLYARRAQLQLRFTSPPAAAARGYRATVRDAFDNVLNLVDQTLARSSAAIEDAKPPGALFPGVETPVAPRRDELIEIYTRLGRTADDLPYTPHFEQLYDAYLRHHKDPKPSRQEVWRHLLNLRKGGKLPKLGEARSMPPEIDEESRSRLKQLLGDQIGRRDRLPYSPEFEKLVDAFNRTLPRPLSPHVIWRLAATLAK